MPDEVNNDSKKSPSWFRRHPFLTALLLLILLDCGLTARAYYHQRTGYCAKDDRYYTRQELMEKVAGEYLKENPYCCSIGPGDGFGTWGDFNDWANLFILHRYILHVESYFRRDLSQDTSEIDRPYYYKIQVINHCGKKLEDYGMTITTESYNAALTRNKNKTIIEQENSNGND